MDQKNWLSSVTVQGALVAALPGILMLLKLFGIQPTSGEATTIINAIVGLTSALGACAAIYGRFRAKTQIVTGKPAAPAPTGTVAGAQ